MRRRERYFDSVWWRHLFMEYRQYVCCSQRDPVGDHNLHGYSDEFEQLYSYCCHNDHSKSASICICYSNRDLRCDE